MLVLALACSDYNGYRAPDQMTEGTNGASEEEARNLLVIGFDTLRSDRLGVLGGSGDATPNLDAVLSEALVLQDHRSCSNWTFGATTCLWAGAYGEEVGFIPEGSYAAPSPAPADLTTIPRWLSSKEGVTTALVGASPWFQDEWNLSDGFEERQIASNADGSEVVDWVADLAPSLAEADGRWMLQVHFLDPHMPFDAPQAYWEDVDLELAERWDLSTTDGINQAIDAYQGMGEVEKARLEDYFGAVYDAEIRRTDEFFAELWDELDAEGLLDEAVVVFWSDHGEQFAEHGGWAHGEDLHREETRALGAIWSPDREPADWTEPTSIIDLLPTALDRMGLDAPRFASGLPVGEADPERPRYLVQGADGETQQGVDVGSLRLFYSWADGMSAYDLASDPGEHRDVYDPQDPEIQALEELIRAQEEQVEELLR